MNIKIPNPNKLPTIKLGELTNTQGELKDLTEDNYVKLKDSILKHGFVFPFAVWTDKDGVKFILDGHQRVRVLENEGWNYDYPYIEIPAKSLVEAAEILLKISSQYGTITAEGVNDYFSTYELEETVMEEITFDKFSFPAEEEKESKKTQLIECPECHYEGEHKDFRTRYEDKQGFTPEAEVPREISRK